MKKVIKTFTLLFTLILAFSLLTVFAQASSCEGEEVNVAKNATVIGDRGPGTPLGEVHWNVSAHYEFAVDGDSKTLCPIDTNEWKNFGLWITLDDSYALSKLVVQTHGVGRAPNSYVVTSIIANRKGSFNVDISFFDETGSEIYNTSATAGDDNIVINLANEDVGRVRKIYIYFDTNPNAQGIWEVEAYSKDTNHNWKDKDVINDSTCSTIGFKNVQCTKCNEEKTSIIPKKPHEDTCKGVCDNCKVPIPVEHIGVDGCLSTECIKCGGEATGIAHIANPDNPCDTTCYKCKTENVITPVHVANIKNPCSNDCGRCGAKEVIPDAYDLAQTCNIYLTHKDISLPFKYATHVPNPSNPCDTTCYTCKEPETVAAVHTPGATTGTWAENNNKTIDPCSSKQCAECGKENAYPAAPHIIVDDPNGTVAPNGKTYYPCSKTCKQCKIYFAGWYTHEFDNCGDEYCNVCDAILL